MENAYKFGVKIFRKVLYNFQINKCMVLRVNDLDR